MAKTINVTIWNEYRHEKSDENVAKLYPNGLHAAIGEFLSKNDDMKITLAALDDPASVLRGITSGRPIPIRDCRMRCSIIPMSFFGGVT